MAKYDGSEITYICMTATKLTEAQREALAAIATVPQTSRWTGGLNVARALARRGLATVTEERTFLQPGRYLTTHMVMITDAGRAALNSNVMADMASTGRRNANTEAVIRERGNGLASVGDYVTETRSGDVYRVVSLRGPIQTGRRSGEGNWQIATVEPADWSDIDDGNEPVCSCEV